MKTVHERARRLAKNMSDELQPYCSYPIEADFHDELFEDKMGRKGRKVRTFGGLSVKIVQKGDVPKELLYVHYGTDHRGAPRYLNYGLRSPVLKDGADREKVMEIEERYSREFSRLQMEMPNQPVSEHGERFRLLKEKEMINHDFECLMEDMKSEISRFYPGVLENRKIHSGYEIVEEVERPIKNPAKKFFIWGLYKLFESEGKPDLTENAYNKVCDVRLETQGDDNPAFLVSDIVPPRGAPPSVKRRLSRVHEAYNGRFINLEEDIDIGIYK